MIPVHVEVLMITASEVLTAASRIDVQTSPRHPQPLIITQDEPPLAPSGTSNLAVVPIIALGSHLPIRLRITGVVLLLVSTTNYHLMAVQSLLNLWNRCMWSIRAQ